MENLNRILSTLGTTPLQNTMIIGADRHSLLMELQRSSVCRWVYVDFQDVLVQSESGLLGHILRSLGIPLPPTCDLESFMRLVPKHLKQPTMIMFDSIDMGFCCPELDDRFWECLRSLACNYAQGNLAYVAAADELPASYESCIGSSFCGIFGLSVFAGELQ